jgi:hypothetical protein
LEINNLVRRIDELELSIEENHAELKGFISREKEIKPKTQTTPRKNVGKS